MGRPIDWHTLAEIRVVRVLGQLERKLCHCSERSSVLSTPPLVHACSVMSDCAIPWTVARQAPLSVEFSRQEYCVGCPENSTDPPGDLPDPGIKPMSLVSPALAGRFFTTEPLGIPLNQALPWLPAFTALMWLEVSPRGSSLLPHPSCSFLGLPSPAAQGPYPSQVLGNGILRVGM